MTYSEFLSFSDNEREKVISDILKQEKIHTSKSNFSFNVIEIDCSEHIDFLKIVEALDFLETDKNPFNLIKITNLSISDLGCRFNDLVIKKEGSFCEWYGSFIFKTSRAYFKYYDDFYGTKEIIIEEVVDLKEEK